VTSNLTAGDRQIDLSSPVCMGIINATPDSFSDGSELKLSDQPIFKVDLNKTLQRAESMVAAGALILDVGGESTRPGAAAVSEEEQLSRVIPIVEIIRSNIDVCISVDTSSAVVMKAAIAAGAEMINDIRALTEEGVLTALAKSSVAICLMHMQGEPRTMQQTIEYANVVDEVYGFLEERVSQCRAAGIKKERLCIDPGFGFGKTLQNNYELLKNLANFSQLDIPILIGLSRKSMIGDVVDRPVGQRLAGSITATVHGLIEGASIIRTHDVAATMDAIRVNSFFRQV
jgi:dihydropteroate synthase